MFLLDKNTVAFPDPELYHPEGGLIAVGGDLSEERILLAYQLGIFPWFNPGEEILWWCPDPRFVIFPNRLKVSKSMKKILDNNNFSFTENKAFEQVIENCEKIKRKGQDGTWLSQELRNVFSSLHKKGIAKSIEVWQNEVLVGGLYGLQFGKVFCGESMFAKVSNASKAGFIHFVQNNDLELIDCQVHTEHLQSLGAEMIPKREYLEILKRNL